MLALEGQSLEYSVNMLTTCILYCYAAVGPGCLINCYKLCCFLSRKLNEVQYQFINSRCIYCYCFVYILYRLLNKQLRQPPRKRILSENRSYHISINKQRFCEHNNCCLPSLSFYSKQILYGVSLEMKFYFWTKTVFFHRSVSIP